MSIAAWLIATRNALRADATLIALMPGGSSKARYYIGVQPQGRPPANMGDWYIGIDETGVQLRHDDTHDKLHELFGIEIVISRKAGANARDRYDEIYESNARSLEKLERAVLVAVHDNQLIRIAANTWLGVPDEDIGDGFTNPLWYTGRGRTELQAGDWNGSEPDKAAFLVRKLPFRGGRRIQAMDVAG